MATATMPWNSASATNAPTDSQSGPARLKSKLSERRGSIREPASTSSTVPSARPPARPRGSSGPSTTSSRPVSTPVAGPMKAMNPSVPSTVISPMTALPSVTAPCDSSGEVTASSRITSRPPAPAAINPAPTPASIDTPT